MPRTHAPGLLGPEVVEVVVGLGVEEEEMVVVVVVVVVKAAEDEVEDEVEEKVEEEVEVESTTSLVALQPIASRTSTRDRDWARQ